MRPTHSCPSAATAPAAADDDAVPADIDEFRNELARCITRFIGNKTQAWRGCRERACRRARGCVAPHIHCSNAAPDTRTPEEREIGLARVRRLIVQGLEQIDALGGARK